ncbi:MAG: HAD-IIIC family phosphatase [Brevundimonas sp.]|nr:MAG: HAD-IIIC family phosphatase [Brevundimonas sp.]
MTTGSTLDELTVALRGLGSSRPDPDDLQRLGRRVRRARRDPQAPAALKIRIISSFLVDMLADAVAGALLRRGVIADVELAPYGALPMELISGSPSADLLMLLPSHRDLSRAPPMGASAEEVEQAAVAEAGFWAGLWPADRPVVQLTFDPPATRPLGEADGLMPGGKLHYARAVNRHMARQAPANVALVDAEALAGAIGADWHNERTYALCKQPFANSAIGDVAEALASTAAGCLGKARKVLVLDLDNTIWGGVIGDVGLKGLVLGMETAEGEAFVGVQRYAQALSRRGVLLAVCSKNDEAIAKTAFGGHSGMVLRQEDIACFVASFDDKATNLRRIAETLNVGLDSLVFVDDNPVERAWVKSQLPEVLVVDLPEDPTGYVQAIESARCFPMHRLTREDLTRSGSYQARAKTTAAASSAADMGAFLADLEPRLTWSGLLPDNADRVIQLIGKTNQFKINPHLFGLEDLEKLEIFAISLSDSLQDYGIVAVVVTQRRGPDFVIRQWVMSCRVFGRRLEHGTLEVLRDAARRHGSERIVMTFTPSAKNGVARDYLAALGFDGESGELAVAVNAALSVPHHMKIMEMKNSA